MYLKSIKAVGFKSFADKIELDIKDGITCIVGPNGSGKSNILDAVKWVLGEQSVKSLRGSGSMSDVIFNGSKSRSPMSRASVALTIDNSNHYLKSEFNEIEVKRVVYRSGENEYYLNNTKVRLKDITDLFIDSGASRDAYNIISQGTVEDIVSSKPEARRVIIEEAAGVLKYKKHKEESLRKLEKTKDNLNTINLLISELETSLEPLRIQSIKAKKFNEYKDNLKTLEIALIVNDIKKINLEYNKLKTRNEELKSLIEELNAKVSKDTATLEVNKLSNLEVEGALNKLNQILVDLERLIADTNAKKTLILERKKLNSNNDITLNNVLNLKEEVLSLEKNINSLEEEILFLTDYIIDRFQKQQSLLKFLSKNLSWGVFQDAVGTGSVVSRQFYDHYRNSLVKYNVNCENPDLLLFTLIELISSTSYNCILHEKPVSMEEYKPYLHKSLKKVYEVFVQD